MDSILTLGLGRLEIDWAKKYYYSNHSKLFLRGDIKPVSHYYFDSETKRFKEELKLGLARPLRSVKRRLELLGYTLSKAKRHFEDMLRESDSYEVPEVSFDVFAGRFKEELKLGLARPLRSVKRRLELLGYTLSKAKRHFEDMLRESATRFRR